MRFLILTILIVSCISLRAQEFSVSVNTDSLLMDNYLEVSFTLKNTTGSEFQAPIFEGFELVGGPNQSSSFQMINGDVTQEISYSYILEPNDIGNHYIEPASIKTEEGYLETKPVEIIVHPNPDGIRQTFPNQSKTFDFFGTQKPPSTPKKPKKKRKIYRM